MKKISGNNIVDKITRCKLNSGEAAVCRLGQHSFILKLGNTVIYIDPYLSPDKNRLIPPLIKPEEILNADIVTGSHDHGDHIDLPVWPEIAEKSPGAIFVVPEAVRDSVRKRTGISAERIIGMNDPGSDRLKDVEITAVAAAHEFLDYDSKTGLYPYLGFIFRWGGVTVFHSGDCCIYEGLQTRLQKEEIDIAMLPINGRDAKRLSAGCIGNMTYQEAADLAGNIKPALTIPAHYDMFKMNSLNPKLFLDYMRVKYPGLKTSIVKNGQIKIFKKEME
ncbi:MAG: MBL fold metallo-hydrolase [Lentisphaerae bacterium]|nr:MBL fold metallo-hydrolase [Lentisphaerota bacterium]